MKIFYKQNQNLIQPIEQNLTSFDLVCSIEKTRQALEIAYSGFNNAVDDKLIDSYIYEINALQKRYAHLTELAGELAEEQTTEPDPLYPHAPVRTLIRQILHQGIASIG
ncbi:MAG: DUF2508 family protein [Lachnospiraceae bacterium]|nr:DUF2508 family protein [Lachnospiraceae bacterium]